MENISTREFVEYFIKHFGYFFLKAEEIYRNGIEENKIKNLNKLFYNFINTLN